MSDTHTPPPTPDHAANDEQTVPAAAEKRPVPVPVPVPVPGKLPKEIGGPTGPEPTRYGDWEQKGRCTDF